MKEKKLNNDTEMNVGMTDEEIVRALEVCTTVGMSCDDCPFNKQSDECSGVERLALELIHRLQGENEQLHTLTDLQEANVNAMNEKNMELRKEIERLTEEKEEWKKSCRLWSGANKSNHLKFTKTLEKLCEERNKNAELQKQVDELTEERENMQAEIIAMENVRQRAYTAGYEQGKFDSQRQVDELEQRYLEESKERCKFEQLYKHKCHERNIGLGVQRKHWEKKVQQTAKDTAKEILQYVGDLYDDGDQRFRLKNYQWHKDLCKRYGVEVE